MTESPDDAEERTGRDDLEERTGRDHADEPAGGTHWASTGSDGAARERAGSATDDPRAGVERGSVDGDGAGGDGSGREDGSADGDEGYSMAGVFGARDEDAPPRPDIVPESPSPENALFVVLGVLLAGLVLYQTVAVLTA